MDLPYGCFIPSFCSFGQMVSEEKIFKNWSIRNKKCLWRPCLLMDRNEMGNLYRGTSIDTSNQVSVHLAEGFQRRLKCEKLTDDRPRTPSDGKSSHCLWQGELKKTCKIDRNDFKLSIYSRWSLFQGDHYSWFYCN